ncbi:putative alanine racemase-domain-containing protein [Melanogaster broomeanus]|nr:putative alanine racemase-domain-containing protein [Melanogaster broomeanus]
MVAVQVIEEISNPRKVIQHIYDCRDRDKLDGFPSAVAKHFFDVFFNPSDPHAVNQLPSLDLSHPPESYTSGTLHEVYLANLHNNRCGGWGIQLSQSDYAQDVFDSSHLRNTTVVWAVSVPAESPWRASEISRPASTSFPTRPPFLPHKFPLPGAPHIGVRVKIYDNPDAEKLRSTYVVTFVGILSSEPLCSEDESSLEVPVLHVVCHQLPSAREPAANLDLNFRKDLVEWISHEALGGDDEAAEWILLQLTSKVYTRTVPLLPPSLTISRFPQPSSPAILPTLSHVLEELLPQYLPIPLSLDLLNTTSFQPESKEEDLHSGYLQLPPGTTTLLTESGIQEGKLLERGIMNVRAIQDVMISQTLEYIFPFACRFPFDTDISIIVVSEGRKSAFFQTSINVPLRCSSTNAILYKPKGRKKLTVYRSYISACRAMSEKVQHIQEDFEDLIHLMKLARLLAASQLQHEVTIDVWNERRS